MRIAKLYKPGFLRKSLLAVLLASLTTGMGLPGIAAALSWSAATRITPTSITAQPPAVISTGSNTLAAYTTNFDQGIYEKKFNGGTWSALTQISGPGTTSLGTAALATGPTTKMLFATGTNKGLYVRSFSNNTWFGWEPLSGASNVAPAAAIIGGKISIFATGTDNALYQKTYDGSTWSDWIQINGPGTTWASPSVVSTGPQTGALFLTGTDGALYQKTFDRGVWGAPVRIGAPGITSQSPAAVANNRLAVYFTCTNQSLCTSNAPYEQVFNGSGWSTPARLTGPTMNVGPSVTSTGSSTATLLLTGTDQAVYQKNYQ